MKQCKVTQLVNTFKIELREAEASGIRALAKSIELQVVLIILANKLFSDLSSADIALGLTNRYSHLVRGYRYVWMFPFTEMHVELVWNRSQVAQTEPFKVLAEKNGQQMSVRRFLMAFMRDVVAGRADKTLVLDPRSCGNERSAANLVEDVIGLFMSCVDSKDILGALMT
ncbi:hypothetical protein HO133_009727 [Letharia lupina]|uniref:Uncharacterized protein n=1 Tax=Letharia lupina TaxID=560253 RepID=A0A8H6FF19_9LECA|nr:uncharacterized protein HO133_009727 [Letharia lupina]KAF6225726.1 hypothetical protein HO133_009727 [Letharia lupina]